jgi:hypothetical protein
MPGRASVLAMLAALAGGWPCAAATRFVYALSGRPASGVKVTWTATNGKLQQETTDRQGRIRTTAGMGRIRVADPRTGAVLLSQGYDDLRETITVGVPIRVSGTVSRFDDAAPVEIDCAYETPISLSDYQRTVQKLAFMERPNENTIYGLSLPGISPRSVRTQAGADGTFVTPWFAATGPAQLLAFQRSGLTAVRTINVSRSVRAGQTIRAGRVSAEFGAALEVTVNVPKTDLPLGLLMGVDALEPQAGAGERTAEILSALHRRDSDVSQFLVRRRELPLALEGTSSFAGLPPLKSLRLSFTGPVSGMRVTRTVAIPNNGSVKITLDAEELLGRRQPRATLAGILRFENGGAPIANATVVFSSYPDRRETTSGADGRFRIPDLVEGRGGTLLIDAPYPEGEPPFDRITETRAVAAVGGPNSSADQVFEVAKPPARGGETRSVSWPSASQTGGNPGVGQFNPIQWNFLRCGTNYTQDELEYVSQPILTVWWAKQDGLYGPAPIVAYQLDWQTSPAFATATIQFAQPGQYVAILEFTPFVFDAKPLWIVSGPIAKATFGPSREFKHVQVQVTGRNRMKVPQNVELYFPGWSPEPSPFTANTDASGNVDLLCVSRWPYPDNYPFNYLSIFVNDPVSGYFAGGANLPASGDTAILPIQLSDPPRDYGSQTGSAAHR